MNAPIAETVDAEHDKGDLSVQATVAATDVDVMFHLLLGNLFVEGMRKHTNQRLTVPF